MQTLFFQSEEECERLRRNIEEIRSVANVTDASSGTALTEPEWVRHTEAKIKAVTEELQPIHYQAQRFAPKISDLKSHLRQILDEIHDRRLKGQLHDDRIREQINAKIQHCHRIASETIRSKRYVSFIFLQSFLEMVVYGITLCACFIYLQYQSAL